MFVGRHRAQTIKLPSGARNADRQPRGLRRHARPGEGRQLGLPGDQRDVVVDGELRDSGVCRRRERRHHPCRGAAPSSPRAQRVRAWSSGAIALAEFAHVSGSKILGEHRAAHRPLPAEQELRRLHAAPDRGVEGAGFARPRPAVRLAHVGRIGGLAGREPDHRARELLAGCAGGARRHGGRDRRGCAGRRRLARHQRQALYDAGRRFAHGRGAGLGENGQYMLAATFGNVHGVYKPGGVKLRPAVLKEIQDEVGAKYGRVEPFDLVLTVARVHCWRRFARRWTTAS